MRKTGKTLWAWVILSIFIIIALISTIFIIFFSDRRKPGKEADSKEGIDRQAVEQGQPTNRPVLE